MIKLFRKEIGPKIWAIVCENDEKLRLSLHTGYLKEDAEFEARTEFRKSNNLPDDSKVIVKMFRSLDLEEEAEKFTKESYFLNKIRA